ncbi:copper amine oxidase N-terminal domain-containing protein [Schinkia azotoformans]|uniref:copper amine oxidase N-terminal domain-containing protein n=1 Tax=Schinkia azotoformans TaxID=1454 RepID=UPI002DBC5454|nr:copper amine oxidase N-terminal domain-containing protein [Schinkia azotoformans]MEC1781366.1 copper amine oxidase N-terminal domain-containing protein [Schinkia azotoformans]MED4328999.1 copper amine oxidase N-terminal domain-containing protein [Schinkia azotoformans]
MNKTLKVMTSAALLAGVVAPVAVTTVDAANTKNIVDKVLYVADDYDAMDLKNPNNLIIRADDMNIATTGDTFRLSLPSGVNWSDGYFTEGKLIDNDQLTVVSRTDRDLELRIEKKIAKAPGEEYKIPLYFEVDGAEGDVKVTVDPRDSVLSGGQYTIAVIGGGKTTASIASVKTIKDGGQIDDMRIDETSLGALYNDGAKQKITLTLPSNFKWDKNISSSNISLGGGFTEAGVIDVKNDLIVTPKDNKLTIEFKFSKQASKIGTFYIKGLKIDADKRAEFGEIEVDLDGDKVSSATIVVAKYGDFGTDASLKGDVPTLLAGRLTDDKKDVETVEVLVKETVAGSWLPGRSVDVEFPTWVKVLGVDVSDAKNIKDKDGNNAKVEDLFNSDIEGKSNEISFDLPSDLKDTDSKREFKVKFYVSTKADTEGDVTVKISGRAGIEVAETVVAKVVAPVKVETEKVDVRTGIKEQPLKDIVITEAVKGALLDDKTVQLKLSNGEFTDKKPKITVSEGNVKIKEDSINVDGGVLTFEIDGESTRASKIVVSGLALDLNRSVPEGEVTVEVGGDAIVQNSTFGDDWALYKAFGKNDAKFGDTTFKYDAKDPEYDLSGKVDAGEFDRDYVVKKAVATVVTPADGNATVVPATFTIGSTTYKVGEVEKTMDVAPFVEAGRTFMPVRYVAEAIGISKDNILWDQATQTATFIKAGNVAQLKVGSKTLTVNGANISMDTAAKVKDGRTVIPVRFVAQALGASVNYDEANKTVTVK